MDILRVECDDVSLSLSPDWAVKWQCYDSWQIVSNLSIIVPRLSCLCSIHCAGTGGADWRQPWQESHDMQSHIPSIINNQTRPQSHMALAIKPQSDWSFDKHLELTIHFLHFQHVSISPCSHSSHLKPTCSKVIQLFKQSTDLENIT